MPERVAILIDGGYLDHVLEELGLLGQIDYRLFAAGTVPRSSPDWPLSPGP